MYLHTQKARQGIGMHRACACQDRENIGIITFLLNNPSCESPFIHEVLEITRHLIGIGNYINVGLRLFVLIGAF